jgi:hypothetical protein
MKIMDEQSLAGFASAAPSCKQDDSNSIHPVKYGFPSCIAVLLLLFQILPLFWNRPFYVDWVNHVWTIQYYSDYLRQHGSFPTTIDVTQGFGSSLPMFYGVFFYPLLSVFSVATGSADLAVRILCGALLVAPLVSFVILFRNLSNEFSLAFLLAISVNASVYQLTNLYARSALTEFVAFQLLLFGISLVFFGLATKSRLGRSAICLGVACGTLSLGSHPITFYTFSIFIAPLLILGYLSIKRVVLTGQLLWTALWVACAVFILLPWGFNTIMYHGDLAVTAKTNVLRFFPASIDSLWGRIGLFYLDVRVVAEGIDAVSTPFLDAPFALGLAVILLVIFIKVVFLNKRELVTLVVPSLLVISAIVWSVIPPHASIGSSPDYVFATWENGFIYRVLSPIQFVYRLTNTFAACVIVALLCGLAAMGRLSNSTPMLRHWSTIVVAYISAVFSVALVGQKLLVTYVEFVTYPEYRLRTVATSSLPKDSDRVLLMTRSKYDNVVRNTASYPVTFYGQRDYTMPQMYQFVTQEEVKDREIVDFRATEYGREISLSCEQACIVRTNIVPSKFHRVLIDGADPSYIKLWNDENVTFPADRGLHVIKIIRSGQLGQYVTASIWIMLGWFAVSCIVFLFGCGKNYFRLVRKLYY